MTTPAPDPPAHPVCRTATGALDIDHYQRQVRELRAQFLHAGLSRLALLLSAGWHHVKTFSRSHARQDELNALDDHALKDLALDRSDLPAIISGAFFVDTTRRQRCATHPKLLVGNINENHASDIALPTRFD